MANGNPVELFRPYGTTRGQAPTLLLPPSSALPFRFARLRGTGRPSLIGPGRAGGTATRLPFRLACLTADAAMARYAGPVWLVG